MAAPCHVLWPHDSVTYGLPMPRPHHIKTPLRTQRLQKDTGAEGDRLKEASAINASLSQLGIVIMLLVQSLRENKPRHIPYRDSHLTFFLQLSSDLIASSPPSPFELSPGETLCVIPPLVFLPHPQVIRRNLQHAQDEPEQTKKERREVGAEAAELAREKAAVEEQLWASHEQIREMHVREERHEEERREQEKKLLKQGVRLREQEVREKIRCEADRAAKAAETELRQAGAAAALAQEKDAVEKKLRMSQAQVREEEGDRDGLGRQEEGGVRDGLGREEEGGVSGVKKQWGRNPPFTLAEVKALVAAVEVLSIGSHLLLYSSSQLLLYSFSPLLIFSSTHHLTFSSTHHLIFSSTHHLISSSPLLSFCSTQLLLYSSSQRPIGSSSPEFIISSSPLLIISSSPLLIIFSTYQLLLYSASPLLIISTSPRLIFSSTHHRVFSSTLFTLVSLFFYAPQMPFYFLVITPRPGLSPIFPRLSHLPKLSPPLPHLFYPPCLSPLFSVFPTLPTFPTSPAFLH
ncbi:unnamed protein product [Closterium sp. NIES-65]|nr:unnamed protein product [Closterium sp. NIES-65]